MYNVIEEISSHSLKIFNYFVLLRCSFFFNFYFIICCVIYIVDGEYVRYMHFLQILSRLIWRHGGDSVLCKVLLGMQIPSARPNMLTIIGHFQTDTRNKKDKSRVNKLHLCFCFFFLRFIVFTMRKFLRYIIFTINN